MNKRIIKEVANLRDDPLDNITTWIDDNDFTIIHADIMGPKDSPYENGSFKVDVRIPDRYPYHPPFPSFKTKVYHPNIDNQGRICLDLIKQPPKGTWNPALNIKGILASLEQLLAYPNPDDPLIAEIADEYRNDYPTFFKKAREFTQLHADSSRIAKDDCEQIQKTEEPLTGIIDSTLSLNKENRKALENSMDTVKSFEEMSEQIHGEKDEIEKIVKEVHHVTQEEIAAEVIEEDVQEKVFGKKTDDGESTKIDIPTASEQPTTKKDDIPPPASSSNDPPKRKQMKSLKIKSKRKKA